VSVLLAVPKLDAFAPEFLGATKASNFFQKKGEKKEK
jgi:hypothetical protein